MHLCAVRTHLSNLVLLLTWVKQPHKAETIHEVLTTLVAPITKPGSHLQARTTVCSSGANELD